MAAEYNATVTGRVEVAPGLIILRVVPDRLPFEFKAGQYVVLGVKASVPRVDEAEGESEPSVVAGARADSPRAGAVAASAAVAGTAESQAAVDAQAAAVERAAADPDRMIRRAYSIASESRADEYIEFYLTLVLSGELTPRLFSLKLRDRVYVGPKAVGVFTLDKVAPGKHVLMIGTGTGLAPYMSMLRSELVCNGPRQFVVVHGARYSWDLGYRTELTGLARHCHNFHYVPVITRPAEDVTWRGRSGYLQNVIASDAVEQETGLPVTPDNFDIFLCGNPGMIETVIAWAAARGFVRDRGHDIGTLHTEEYW